MKLIRKYDYKKILNKCFIILLAFIAISFILESIIRIKFLIYPRDWVVDKKLGWKTAPNYHFKGYKRDACGNKYFVEIYLILKTIAS